MDGDDFSRATRLGRTAVAAIWDSISNGVPFDGFATGQLIDRFVGHADGIPSLQPILTILVGLAAEPLFIQAGIAEAIERVDDAAGVADGTMLDLQLRDVRAAAAELLRRPDAKRLGLTREFFERLNETSNLLGAA